MNIFPLSLLVILAISQNIFILNEEFLILICFILFCLLSYEKLGLFFFNFLNNNSKKLQELLLLSFYQYSSNTKELLNWNKKTNNTLIYFKFLKFYYKNLNQKILFKLINFQNNKKSTIFVKKLQFIKNLESQFLKLILLIILEKTNQIVLLHNFYYKKCKIKKFDSINTIKFREYLEIL